MEPETEKRKEEHRVWYKNNKQNHLKNVKKRQKDNNYSYEKTEKQRMIRNIKRKTRYYFLLEGHNCEFCGKIATEHHHYTIPIEFDKFNYVCPECHLKEDKKLNSRSKLKGG